jgi:hypothetical protein
MVDLLKMEMLGMMKNQKFLKLKDYHQKIISFGLLT